MLERFQGAADSKGRRLLIDEIKQNPIVEHDEELAKAFANVGELQSYAEGEVIINEGDSDNDVYLLIAGTARVSIKDRFIADRKAPQVVGEMAILNAAEPRSATLKALDMVIALKVSEPEIQTLAEKFPQIWKPLARINAQRLRQRSDMLMRPNTNSRLFIGCSVESLEVAEEIQSYFQHDKDISVICWSNDVFEVSNYTLEDLFLEANESDFAAFIFSPDDFAESRGKGFKIPRDNVVFELGLFMGKLERRRTFIIADREVDIKIPSDLLGVKVSTFLRKPNQNLTASLSPVCREIRKRIKELGPR